MEKGQYRFEQTGQQIQALLDKISEMPSAKAVSDTVAGAGEMAEAIGKKADSEAIARLIQALATGKADKADTYTKEESDAAMLHKADKTETELALLGKIDVVQDMTHAELTALRDEGELIPGQLYRITDYVATTSQEGTRSANHPFDVVVCAATESQLFEEARALPHEDDTYFQNARLEAWRLKYCLDNDTTRFAWAKDASSTARLYKTDIERFPNLPDTADWYEADGQQTIDGETYNRWRKYEGGQATRYYILTALDADLTAISTSNPYTPDGWMQADEDGDLTPYTNGNTANDRLVRYEPSEPGKGVIYELEDEYGNRLPFDFKGIEFLRYAVTDITGDNPSIGNLQQAFVLNEEDNQQPFYFGLYNAENDEVVAPASQGISAEVDTAQTLWCTAFMCLDKDTGRWYDPTADRRYLSDECIRYAIDEAGEGLNTCDRVEQNVVEPLTEEYIGDDYYTRGRRVLNNLVFFSHHQCFYNEEDEYWEYDVAETYANEVKENGRDNTFGSGFSNNSCGSDCYNNTFGSGCYRNTFGSWFTGNSIGSDCYRNTFGSSVQQNSIGSGFSDNSCGSNVRYIKVFDGVQYAEITGGSGSAYVQNAQILSGIVGTSSSKVKVQFATNKAYTQVAGKATAGALKIWNPADLAQ